MQIQPGERTLLAYFTNEASAQQSLSELENAGFHDIQVDLLNNPRLSVNTINNSSSLSALVYNNSGYDKSFGPLIASNPQVSGMSSTVRTDINYNHILTMITDNENYSRAVAIIRQNGGSV